jgi:putative oxidoreductase
VIENRSKPDQTTAWVLRICVAVVFSITGLEKFASSSSWVQTFDAIGLGQWFRYFTGVVELLGGLLFLVPPATVVGGFLLIASMVGAMVVQAFVFKQPAASLFPGAYLLGVVLAFATIRRSSRDSARR